MYLEKVNLLNYKNYEEANILFHDRINVFVGKNGSGKTNLLDAIHYLSLTRSAFTTSDAHCIRTSENFFFLKGTFQHEGDTREVLASVQTGAKKVFRENSLDYARLSEHIGKFPLVLIVPDDSDVVKEGSELRRKFFDAILSQIDKKYLEHLIQYNFALRQRNSLLKLFADGGRFDPIALETYDDMLVNAGSLIYKRRAAFLEEFCPIFQRYYAYIVEDCESTSIRYVSSLNDVPFTDGLLANRQKDMALQRTNFGVHRDDFDFLLGDGDLKRLGSQGQQKSFVIALKLSQFEIFEKYKGFKPLLLLDDIFDKLDDNRINKLLELIKESAGQLFITDARPHRTTELLRQVNVEAAVFGIEKGKVSKLE